MKKLFYVLLTAINKENIHSRRNLEIKLKLRPIVSDNLLNFCKRKLFGNWPSGEQAYTGQDSRHRPGALFTKLAYAFDVSLENNFFWNALNFIT